MRSLKHLPLLVIVLCALLPLALFRNAAAADAPAAAYSAYLPLVRQSGRADDPATPTTPPTQPTTPPTQPTTPPTQPTPTPPAGPSGALFLEPDQKAASPSIAVDAQGGMHMAYHYYVSENEGGPHIVYSYCPPPAEQCGSASSWSHVSLPPVVDEVQLQLTPDGKPRLLGARSFLGVPNGVFLKYIYAECDADCLNAASWRTAEVTSARQGFSVDARELPRRSFALDHEGRPRFLLNDDGSNLGDGDQRYGGYLYSCDADCSMAENWAGTLFTQPDPNGGRRGELVVAPVLKFTSANQPRVLGVYYALSSEAGHVTQVAYFACDGGCDDYANWGSADLAARGNGPEPAYDLELDANDRPRAVVYHEETPSDTSKRLFYYQCDASCTDAGAWRPVNLGLNQTVGKSADLALDAAGNPSIAHLVNHGTLAYSWCKAACDQSASWQHGEADTLEDLDASDPVAIPPSCVKGGWSNYGVSFAFDPQGNPRVAYNAVYYADCINLPHPGLPPTSGYQEIAHRVRVFFTLQP